MKNAWEEVEGGERWKTSQEERKERVRGEKGWIKEDKFLNWKYLLIDRREGDKKK